MLSRFDTIGNTKVAKRNSEKLFDLIQKWLVKASKEQLEILYWEIDVELRERDLIEELERDRNIGKL